MRISDWSSDVCSSDLRLEDIAIGALLPRILRRQAVHRDRPGGCPLEVCADPQQRGLAAAGRADQRHELADRKSVVSGKSVSVSVNLGGHRIIKKKKHILKKIT